jgi:hypothetical protein
MKKLTLVALALLIIIGVSAVGNSILNKDNEDGADTTLDPSPDEPSSTEETTPDEPSQPEETPEEEPIILPTRESKLPDDVVKITPEMDFNPPISYSDEYYDPVPVPGLVNTLGGEDSPFMMPDGETLYFFFTPDVRIPVEKQLLDEVSGIYISHLENGSWGPAERVMLQNPGKLAMDGCEEIIGDVMYFASAREGYTGVRWFKAEYINGSWCNWVNNDDWMKTDEYQTGEMQITFDGQQMYFHSDRPGGMGGYDIWVSEMVDGEWGEPVNIVEVNTERMDGWPYINEEGTELWITHDYGVWRSVKVDGVWQAPEQMFYPLAGEATLDRYGNVYFTHHFYDGDTMLEADIYVAYKK